MFPYGPVVQMAYVVAPANLPPDIRNKLSRRCIVPGSRFKDFAKQNAFLVDDMTGDALNKEIGDVTTSIDTVATQTFPRTE